jgi:hypothetical protein
MQSESHRRPVLSTTGELYLYNNVLTGTIPAEIGTPVLFRKFRVHQPYVVPLKFTKHHHVLFQVPFTLTVISFMARYPSLSSICDTSVGLRWPFPLSERDRSELILFLLAVIESLYLFENELSGPIPKALGSLRKLRKLHYCLGCKNTSSYSHQSSSCR